MKVFYSFKSFRFIFNNNDFVVFCGFVFEFGFVVVGFDGSGFVGDVNSVVFFGSFEDGKGIEGGGIFDVVGFFVEVGWEE